PVQLRLKLCALPFLLRCIRNNSRKARRSDPRQRLCGSNLDRPRHRRRGGVGCQACVEEANHRHRRLLRASRERPSGYTAAEKRDEFPPPHGAYPKAKDHGRSIADLEVGQWRPTPNDVAAALRGSRKASTNGAVVA